MWWIALSNVSKTGAWKVSSKKQLQNTEPPFWSMRSDHSIQCQIAGKSIKLQYQSIKVSKYSIAGKVKYCP